MIAKYDHIGFFEGFSGSLYGYRDLVECTVVSVLTVSTDSIGVDIYKDGKTEYIPHKTFEEATKSIAVQSPKMSLYRTGVFEGRPFKNVIYVFPEQ